MKRTLSFLSVIFLITVTASETSSQRRKSAPTAKTPSVQITDNKGGVLVPSDEVLVPFVGSDVLRIYPDVANPDVLYATTPFGLYKTDNSGRYWSKAFDPSDFGIELFKLDNEKTFDSRRGYVSEPENALILAQSKSDPKVLYLAPRDSMWKSEDRGNSWKDISAGIIGQGTVSRLRTFISGEVQGGWDLRSLVVSPSDPLIVYALYGGKIFKTLNGGNTWGTLNLTLHEGAKLFINPHKSENLFLWFRPNHGADRNWESFDGGKTWTVREFSVSLTKNKVAFDAFYFHPIKSNIHYAFSGVRLFHSEDTGLTWKEAGKFPAGRGVPNIAFAQESDDKIFLASHKGVFASNDRGESWKQIFSLGTAVASTKPGHVFVLDNSTIYKSVDAGSTWYETIYGLPNYYPEYPQLFSQFPCASDDELIYLCSGKGLYSTSDKGQTWKYWDSPLKDGSRITRVTRLKDGTLYLNGIYGGQGLYAGHNSFVKITPDGKSTVVYSRDDFGIVGTVSPSNPSIIYGNDTISTDDGFSWKRMNVDFSPNETYVSGYRGVARISNIVSPVSPRVAYIYAHVRKSIHVTTNQGETWRTIVTPEETGGSSSITPDPTEPLSVYWNSENAAYYSPDAGLKWQRLTPQTIDFGRIRGFAVHPEDNNKLFIASDRGLFKSLNQGKQWQFVNRGLYGDKLNKIYVSSKEVIVHGSNGIYFLTDNIGELAARQNTYKFSVDETEVDAKSSAKPEPTPSASAVLEELKGIQDSIQQAGKQGNKAVFEKYLDEAYVYKRHGVFGKTYDKAKYLKNVKPGNTPRWSLSAPRSSTCFDHKLSFENEVAALNLTCDMVEGSAMTFYNRYSILERFVKKDGEWKLLSTDSRMVPKK